MNRSEQIREVLRAAPGPMTAGEITKVIPGIATHYAVGVMFRAGMLARDGKPKAYRYWLAREPVDTRLPREELKARRQARERKRYRQQNPRTLAEFRAEQAAQRAERLARLQAEKEQRQRDRRARKREKQPSRAGQIAIAPAKPCATKAIVRQVRPESIDAWMQRTGKQIERLPNGAVSQPLQRIGFPQNNA